MVPVADLCFCKLEKVRNEVSLCSRFKVEFIVIPSIYNTKIIFVIYEIHVQMSYPVLCKLLVCIILRTFMLYSVIALAYETTHTIHTNT